MVIVTPAAQRQLLQLIAAHPEDPVVRLSVKDLDHGRIAFSITLESEPHADDQVQNLDGMQIAVEGRSAARLDGITIDYEETLHSDKKRCYCGAKTCRGTINRPT